MNSDAALSTPRQPRAMMTATPSNAMTPCTSFGKLTLNSSSSCSTRTKAIPNMRRPMLSLDERMEMRKSEETPEHRNLTMVLGDSKIQFDEWFDDDNNKEKGLTLLTPNDDYSDYDSEDDAMELSHSFSPGSLTMSPDNGFLRPMFDMDELDEEMLPPRRRRDPHYDPTSAWLNEVYTDEDDTPQQTDDNTQNTTGQENDAPQWWSKHCQDVLSKQIKLPVDPKLLNRRDAHTLRKPLMAITVDQPTVPQIDQTKEDQHASTVYGPPRKKQVVGQQNKTIRFMRSLSPTRSGTVRKSPSPQLPSSSSSPSSSASSSSSSLML
ncbi:hypothetical protein BC940DRAFT_74515 [Gongronella butleri]|nr:hypothetical protein BC940DRAFT_74515 [Gongronella butleri]